MDISKLISSIIFAILWAVTLVIVFTVTSGSLARFDTYNTAKIIHDCAQDYSYQITNTDTGRITTRPLEQQVRECIYQKGVKKSSWDGVWSKDAEESAVSTLTPTKSPISRK
jgi:hypothetical protein